MTENAFPLEILPQPRPGQTLEDALVEQAVGQANPEEAAAIRAAAVPTLFDADILGALLGEQPADASRLVGILVNDYPFVTRSDGHCVIYAPARHAIRELMRREGADRLHDLNATAARYFEARAQTLPEGDAHDAAVRAEMYHLLGSHDEDQTRGYELLLDLFGRAEEEYKPGVAYLLVRLAREQSPELTEEHLAGLAWLEGRLALLQGRHGEAVRILEGLLGASPPPGLRAHVELDLARALSRDERWVDAVEHALAAQSAFRAAGQPDDEARALIELAGAHAGLAASVRGSRAARASLPNPVVNAFYEIGSFLERVPILLYLLINLGFWRLLPVLGRIGRDQDWVVARLFVNAAVYLRHAETLLRDSSSSAEVWFSARRASATLYRTLGHPAEAAGILGDLLGRREVRDNPYRLAVARLQLADALLDMGRPRLAAEELALALPTLSAVRDLRSEAQGRVFLGRATVAAEQTAQNADPANLALAVGQMRRSLELYGELEELGDRAARAARSGVARSLDAIAGDECLAADHPVRIEAEEAARTVPERRYPVRYEHPRVRAFRTGAVIGLSLAFLIILFLGMRTSTGTEVGAAALIRIGQLPGNSADAMPSITVELPAQQQLLPKFRTSFVASTVLAVLAGYALLWVIVGLGLISLTSTQALRQAQPATVVLDEEGIRYHEGEGDAPASAVAWASVEEAVAADRGIGRRPIATYSHLALFGGGAAVDVSARAVTYEAELGQHIRGRLSQRPRQLGTSILHSWVAPVFLLGVVVYAIFLGASAARSELPLRDVLGPYALGDLYLYSYILLLAPLGWLLVISPLREALVLRPYARWPLALGVAGILAEGVLLLIPRQVMGALPAPDVYPVTAAAFLVVAACVFVWRARYWQGRPSQRRGCVYPRWARAAAVLVAVLAVAAALRWSAREVRAYHALVWGNQWRDWANAQPDRNVANQELARAIDSYNQAVALAPVYAAPYANRGAAFAAREDLGKAIQDFNEAIQRWPDQAVLYANRAVTLQRLAHQVQPLSQRQTVMASGEPALDPKAASNLEQAVADYRQAVALDPSNSAYHVQLGIILHELRRYEEAAAEYSRALQIDARDADALAGRGWADFQIAVSQQRKEKAASKRLDDTPLTQREARGTHEFEGAMATAGKWEHFGKAWEDFNLSAVLLDEKAGLLGPGDPAVANLNIRRANVANGLALVALKLSQNQSALSFFQRAAGLDPGNGDYLISLANVHWLLAGAAPTSITPASKRDQFRRHIEGAVAAYEQAMQLRLDRRNLAYLYRTLGQFHYLLRNLDGHDYRAEMERSIEAYDQAIALDPRNLDYRTTRGGLHEALAIKLQDSDRAAAQAHYRAAIDDLTAAIALGSRNLGYRSTRGRLHSALAYMIRGPEWAAAQEQYQAAIEDLTAAIGMGAGNEIRAGLATAYIQLGWGFHLHGDDVAAIPPTQQAIGAAPKDSRELARAHFNLSVLRLYTGDTSAAREEYARAIEAARPQPAAYAEAISDLNDLKVARPELAAIADEMIAQIRQAQGQ